MKRYFGLLAALALLLGLYGCGAGGGGAAPSPSAPPEEPTTAVVPSESEPPAESDEPVSAVEPNYWSDYGWGLVVPRDEADVREWPGGVTIALSAEPGCYLAVSLMDADSASMAVAAIKYETGAEGDPTGVMFGAEGYAGLKLVQTTGPVTQEYIVYQQGQRIYLVELAELEGTGPALLALLRDMLDTIQFE